MAHSYFIAGALEEGISVARTYVEEVLGQSAENNPNIVVLRHGLLSVDDARRLRELAELAPSGSDRKSLIVSAGRLFHEAQNALLKLFEEPPAGTLLVLVIPSEGILLPTLRSRLIPLPGTRTSEHSELTTEFLSVAPAARAKLVEKLLDRAKSDKDEEKQAARLEALQLAEGLARVAHDEWRAAPGATRAELEAFLSDLNRFIPILHERSAPLKLMFEHVLLTLPPLPKLKQAYNCCRYLPYRQERENSTWKRWL